MKKFLIVFVLCFIAAHHAYAGCNGCPQPADDKIQANSYGPGSPVNHFGAGSPVNHVWDLLPKTLQNFLAVSLKLIPKDTNPKDNSLGQYPQPQDDKLGQHPQPIPPDFSADVVIQLINAIHGSVDSETFSEIMDSFEMSIGAEKPVPPCVENPQNCL